MHAGKPQDGVPAAILLMVVPRLCAANRWSVFLQSQWRKQTQACAVPCKHIPSEVALQPAVVTGTMTGIHVYGQKARLANCGFIYVL